MNLRKRQKKKHCEGNYLKWSKLQIVNKLSRIGSAFKPKRLCIEYCCTCEKNLSTISVKLLFSP